MELGIGEIIVILAIALLLFGPSKLPKLGEGLGRAIRNFRDAVHEDDAPKSANAEPLERAQPPGSSSEGPARSEPVKDDRPT